MEQPDVELILSGWDFDSRQAAQHRVARFLALTNPPSELRKDTLGQRNYRLLELHEQLFGAPIEARVKCASCDADNEFALPKAAMLGSGDFDPDTCVAVDRGDRSYRLRLPRIADIEAAAQAGGDIKRQLLQRCRLDEGPPPDELDLAAIEAELERLDPLANLAIETACAHCQAPILATVELADFIARDIDRVAAALLRDIDTIAVGYGWSEQAIIALPAARRARYVQMIAARRTAQRSGLTGLRA